MQNKQITILLMTLLLGGFVMVASAATLTLHVSPDGNDRYSGALPIVQGDDGPFATLQRAREEVRFLLGRETGDAITVMVHGGTYELTQSFELGLEDSGIPEQPVIWQGVKDEPVILAGARKVTGFKPYEGEIMQCDLTGTALEGIAFRQLFFKGERMVLARTPNIDATDPHGGTWGHIMAVDNPKVTDHFTFTPDIAHKSWTNVEQITIGIFPYFDWAWNRVPVKSIDFENRVLTMAPSGGFRYELHVGDRFYVENIFEELDAPGEWYLDRDNLMLYFWPPSPIDSGDVLAPVTDTVVRVKNAKNIIVRGFTIEACDGDGVQILDSDNCSVESCVVRNCGSWGITVSKGQKSGAFGNDVYATGAGGIYVFGGDRQTLTPGENFATNNYVHHVAAIQRTYNPGISVNGVGNLASNNLVHDCPHAGMTLGGNDNIVEYNVVHHTNLQSGDTGGIYYCSRDWTQRGNIIRYNIWHHCGGFGKANSWAPVQNGKVKFEYPHFTWGIYLDDPTSGTQVYGNVLWSVPICGLHNHGGRDNNFENNIVIDAPAFQAGMLWDGWEEWPSILQRFNDINFEGSPYLEKYPELRDYNETHPAAQTGIKLNRNIFYYTEEGSKWLREKNKDGWQNGQLLYTYATDTGAFPACEFDFNTVYAPAGIDLKINFTRAPEPGGLLNWEDWQKLGMDQNSIFADPKFVDPENFDFRLQPDSPALKQGFKPIPFEKIGLFADSRRATWPLVEAPGASRLGDFTTERYFEIPGYEPVPAVDFSPRKGLGRTIQKLNAGEPVRIAYYGGGIHDAGGWRGQLLDWMRNTWPATEITEIDAGICDCVRGSGFSVYRYAHDVLAKKPDLVLVDYASDDFEANADNIYYAIEPIIRQTWQTDPEIDILFTYAFRQGYETDYAKELSPATISAYEKLAAYYGIPSVNMGFSVAQKILDGSMQIRSTADTALLAFSSDGVRPSADGNAAYTESLARGLEQLASIPFESDAAVRNALATGKPYFSSGMDRAKQVPITSDMLSGEWEKIAPTNIGERDFSRQFDDVWFTNTPGAMISFKFRGTDVSLFDLMGPDTGRVRITVDGKDLGISQQVDPWSYYPRLATIYTGGGLEDTEHTVTVELLPEPPDRTVPMNEAKRLDKFVAEDFEGVTLYLGFIRMVGDIVK